MAYGYQEDASRSRTRSRSPKSDHALKTELPKNWFPNENRLWYRNLHGLIDVFFVNPIFGDADNPSFPEHLSQIEPLSRPLFDLSLQFLIDILEAHAHALPVTRKH